MVCSLDGHRGSRQPKVMSSAAVRTLQAAVAEQPGRGSWLCGRVTAQEFARKGKVYPPTDQVFARGNRFVCAVRRRGSSSTRQGGVGALRLQRRLILILTEAVPAQHLAGLRGDKVSYIFAGKTEIDLAAALETLNRELGIEHLMLEGGGGANGALLRAGLVDEISLVISPVIDGASGAPAVFNSGSTDLGPAPIERMVLANHQILDGGAVWLRYRLGQAVNP